ncbi:MAG: aldehyde dehydrogenase family protein, partial [Gemmatimonadaceae bacterium]|nr:aldehyde dehydrogenase family protein [Gemmatimonadaceae bacterium]
PGAAAGNGSCFFPPTVLVDVAPGSRVLTEETFGPVVPVIRVRDAEEAIRLANASGLGLSASVWGRDLAQAERVARALEAGSVMINDTVSVVGIAEAPHGGVKGSGFGRSHGAEGLAECVCTKAIVVDRLAGVRQPWWFGYSAERARNTDAFVRLRHGARLAERVRAVPRALRLLRRGDRAV